MFLNNALLNDPSRDILFLGEGNFTFAKSFVQRYPGLSSRLVASDVKLRKDATSVRNQEYLTEAGVLVGKLDAGNLPKGAFTAAAVYFNCPCGENRSPIPDAIKKLLRWSKRHLSTDGTLHISCHGNQRDALRGIDLPLSAESQGLVLYNTNNSLQERFPTYKPTRTCGGQFSNNSLGRVHEYIYRTGTGAVKSGVDFSILNGVYIIKKVSTLPFP